MKAFGKKGLAAIFLALLTTLCVGCVSSSTVEDLFTLPQPPIEYTGLSQTIEKMIAAGYEYASPTGGQNIQSVQMEDLNGDGQAEAITFFRKPNDEKPLKIIIFAAQEDSFRQLCTIESSGTAVDRIDYEDMNGDGHLDLVVGWKISADLQTVAVYSVDEEPVMLTKSNYTRYSIQDMDNNGIPSLLVFRTDEEGKSMAAFYGWRKEAMELAYRCSLSSTMAELSSGSIVSGLDEDGNAAVYVTGVNDQGMAVTDILVCRENGAMTNAALNQETGLSRIVFPYRQIDPQDINGDGIIEIPSPMVEMEKPGARNNGVVEWISYDADGDSSRVETTYHCLSSGWYFNIPEGWENVFSANVIESGLNETEVMMRLNDQPVLAIYALTGENRENRALRGNRMVLKRQTAIVYAGELLEGSEAWGVDEELLRSHFNMIVDSWMVS